MSLHINKRGGFSLVEVVLYASLFAVLSVLALNAILQMFHNFNSLRVSRDLNDSSVMIIEHLTRDMKSATNIDVFNSTFDASPGRLTLATANASGTALTVEYFVASGVLRIKENGVDQGFLSAGRVRVDNLTFRRLLSGTTDAVKIELQLSATRAGITRTEYYYDTAVLRGSY